MRVIHQTRLISAGTFPAGETWSTKYGEIIDAIRAVVWPTGASMFTLYDESGKGRGKGNGVKPIKNACMAHLQAAGWALETKASFSGVRRPGPIDATWAIDGKYLCVEWETGNISSSHRALNKMAIGMLAGKFIGGILILPTRAMYKYLTDRVGNYEEIEPYFPLWRSLAISEGILMVVAIEHDAVSRDVPRITKGTDGRALQ